MLLLKPPTATANTISTVVSSLHPAAALRRSLPKPATNFPRSAKNFSFKSIYSSPRMSWLSKLGFGTRTPTESSMDSSIAQGPDDDIPAPGQQFAQFGAGCFWGVELAFQRVPGITKTEVGYTQGFMHNPTYEDICTGTTNHSEVVRVQYDPKECTYDSLLDAFWARHDPTTPNRSGNDVGTQYRSGIYFYSPEQEQAAVESKERQQKLLNRPIVTEILPAKKFYRAEEYHQFTSSTSRKVAASASGSLLLKDATIQSDAMVKGCPSYPGLWLSIG